MSKTLRNCFPLKMAGLNAFANFGASNGGGPSTGSSSSNSGGPSSASSQAHSMFKTLRRLHGHNLENQGLNDLSEAFQNFITRAKFFSMGRLRRTWSHSAVEFMKYRRLLPMLVADEHHPGSVFDDFDAQPPSFSARTTKHSKNEGKKVTVTNISPRVTSAQLQSFFRKFGKVSVCKIPTDDKKQSAYSTLPKKSLTRSQLAHVTFSKEEGALAALSAPSEELTFYGQQMAVQPYISMNRRRTISVNIVQEATNAVAGTPPSASEDAISRSSSVLSVSSNSTINSAIVVSNLQLDEFPTKVLEQILSHCTVLDAIRLERVSKRFLEASIASWKYTSPKLSFSTDSSLSRHFTSSNPLKNSSLKAILVRDGVYLKALDLSDTVNVLNDKAIEDIAHFCPYLFELDISGIHASTTAFQSLSENLCNLQKLSYRDMRSTNEKSFWYLFKNCGINLKHVDLRGCTRLKGRCFKLCGMSLEEVLLDGCTKVDDETIDDICLKSANVKILRLNGCGLITDSAISTIARHLCDLREFSLAGDRFLNLTTAGLIPFLRIQTIKKLEFDHNPLVTDELIAKLVDSLPKLEKLSIGFSGNDAFLTESSLSQISKLKNLKELDLSGIAAINNKLFKTIISGCLKLTDILLRNCIYLGDSGIEELKNLAYLRYVDLSSCILVTSTPIQALIKHFKPQKDVEQITIVVGGTVCEPSQVRIRDTRIILDFNDYSATSLAAFRQIIGSKEASAERDSDNESDEDDGFQILDAHRSFIVDALNAEDDFPLDQDEKTIREWAEKEAKELGLTDSTSSR
uniref:Uncharacterized protein n=1 Tax=Panagrolaimus superbus TaxID=310955 RepID=A0A914XSJ9_9BILA